MAIICPSLLIARPPIRSFGGVLTDISQARPQFRNPWARVRSIGEGSKDERTGENCLLDVQPWSVCGTYHRTPRVSRD